MRDTTEVVRAAGVSYRQLDYWTALGYLHPEPADNPGQGHARHWSEREVWRARVLGGLVHLGFRLTEAAHLMQILDDQDGGLTTASDGIVDLTLSLRTRP